jgi:hypothetical protein
LDGNSRQLKLLNGVRGTHLAPFYSVTFASLSGHPIMDKDTVIIGMHVLNQTGLFPKEYKTWIFRCNEASKMNDFVSFKTF